MAVHPQQYLFTAPIEIPTIIGGPRGGFLDVFADDDVNRLRWRSMEDWPVVIRASTGERARLVRAITNDVHTLPRLGRVTLIFEQCIFDEEQNELHQSWDENDWQIEDEGEAG